MTSVIPRAPQWSAQPVIRTVTFQVEPPQKEQCPTLMDQPNLPTQRITPNESTYPLSKHVGTQAPWKLVRLHELCHCLFILNFLKAIIILLGCVWSLTEVTCSVAARTSPTSPSYSEEPITSTESLHHRRRK